ncbi:hypothetical protein CU102_12145 [Phyllobacterium brassicacearum]|uniref:DUF1697 domain-containing protein n=1 Tax=Phyllobacterium brassicacearum TaxID=314235 RepID=A0A2P7BPY6_9HYPH|nr:DUF1697 domain-containing protein [Phyllobacterium brassicacearum]PSH68519.1 hypothetical protein CU102_12145 [Phyllobacterium brassicacearum]TDQ19853.1 uncharacterized protein (DUF1697 family) [Phyllobacterium brassicacearum]
MTTYIVLFRGINVGGNKVVKMETLRTVLNKAGFTDVKTYIQSGNLVLTSNQTARRVGESISALFPTTFGFESRVSVRNIDEWNCMIAKNPYPGASDNPKSLHAVILDGDPTESALADFAGKASESESFTLRNRVLYLYTPDGFGTSKLALALDKVLKVPLTARNWRTVLTIQKMAAAI